MALLPTALLDLAFTRFLSRPAPITPKGLLYSGACRRAMHALGTSAYEHSDQQDVECSPCTNGRRRPRRTGVLAVRANERPGGSLAHLERRVQELQATVISEVSSTHDLPAFSEEELLMLYDDLLALPPSDDTPHADPKNTISQQKEDLAIINAADQRLIETQTTSFDSERLSKMLRSLQRWEKSSLHADALPETRSTDNSEVISVAPSSQPYHRVLTRVQNLMTRMETMKSSLLPHASVAGQEISSQPEKITISILSKQEWESLIRVCIHVQDNEAAALSLNLMKRSGISPLEESVNLVLESYANSNNVAAVDAFMTHTLAGPPTDRQRHLHIRTHLSATPPNTISHSALSVLHMYEARNLPATIPTYTRVITSLFSVHSSLAHAQAWDLFTHMRFVAHPTPDALLYTLMIRACASSLTSPSEPERALDLWTEMTIEKRIEPTPGTYNAIILVCARSGVKGYVNEAFRLAKEMLDGHRDAQGRSAFKPDTKTFCALLEGAKRMGDLGRARWILAEMVRARRSGLEAQEVADAEVDEEVMMHMFHAYAAYHPPFKRTSTVLVDEEDAVQPGSSISIETGSMLSTESQESLPVEEITQPSFSHIPPQSHSEVAREAKALFSRILRDTGVCGSQQGEDSAPKLFKNVQLTARLVNSYLSVHYAHSPLNVACDLFKTLFSDGDVQRNTRSYVEALERCGIARRGRERAVALVFAENLWVEWQSLEDSGDHSVDARSIERARVAMIRILTLTGHIDRAVDHVKSFLQRYPPTALRGPASKPAMRSTRTVLVGTRPLVRMSSTVEVPDDTVPPLLTFIDVEVLHHRLVAAGRLDMVRFLTYWCKSYEGALRVRRDRTIKAEPAKEDYSGPLVGAPTSVQRPFVSIAAG